MTATPTHQRLQPEFRLLVFLVSIGFFMQGLDTTIINTALPAMAKSLNEDPLRMHGVVISYVLSVAACIPLSGWLADRFGVRNTFFTAIVIFTLASLGCGLSQNFYQLIGSRYWWCFTPACRSFSHVEVDSKRTVSLCYEHDEFSGLTRSVNGPDTRRLSC